MDLGPRSQREYLDNKLFIEKKTKYIMSASLIHVSGPLDLRKSGPPLLGYL